MENYVFETHLRQDQTPVLLADPTPLELVTTAWSVPSWVGSASSGTPEQQKRTKSINMWSAHKSTST